MKDYVKLIKHDTTISVCFYIEMDKPFAIGEKMYEIDENAYMNGYNWEAFFNYYLERNYPKLLEGFNTDPEAGMYVAYYENTVENEEKANKFVKIIEDLIENEDSLYKILKEDADKIEWD